MLIAAIVVFMVALALAIGLALVKANPSEDEIAEAQQESLAELEVPPHSPVTYPDGESTASSGRAQGSPDGGAHGPLPSEAGRASPNQSLANEVSPKHLDLPRLG